MSTNEIRLEKNEKENEYTYFVQVKSQLEV